MTTQEISAGEHKKYLPDNSELTLKKYTLTKEVTAFTQRPNNSFEIQLNIKKNGYPGKGTMPSTSWFLEESYFLRIYNGVKNYQQFLRICETLRIIESRNNINKLELILNELNI